jgi:hypothetical protein
MARIRTIKPEFFHHEAIASCTPHARLLAIALLQLADGAGRMRWIPMQVHAHAFPFEDQLDVAELANELEAIGYLVRYAVDGKKYACIPGFSVHQRITGKEAETESQYPPFQGETTGNQQGNTECFPEKHLDAQEREREREREKEREKEGEKEREVVAVPALVADATRPCPAEMIVDLFNSRCTSLPQVRTLTDQRRKAIRARWRESPERQDPGWWAEFFGQVSRSPFLNGANDRNWSADFDWLMKPANLVKVSEGKYLSAGPQRFSQTTAQNISNLREFVNEINGRG